MVRIMVWKTWPKIFWPVAKCFSRVQSFSARAKSLFVKLLAVSDLQKKCDTYWKKSDRWDPLGVIESFMNPTFELSDNMEDLCFILSKIGLICFTQSDTERVVKTIRKTETRFAGYNEIRKARSSHGGNFSSWKSSPTQWITTRGLQSGMVEISSSSFEKKRATKT